MSFKITTWNVNSLKVRLPQVIEFLQKEQVDVLCLQELKMQDEAIDRAEFEALGYDIRSFGQKTYNGVATITKKGVAVDDTDVIKNIPGFDDPQSRVLTCSVKVNGETIRIVNGYFPNGESLESEKFPYKLAWLKALREWLKSELKSYPNLVLLGDFNIAPEDIDVWNPESWADSVLCAPQSRQAFKDLIDLGLTDAFRMHEQPEKSYSWWDYRMMAFRRNHGLRIDHILITKSLAEKNLSVVINKTVRANERPSDHAPVTLELDL